MIEPSADPPFVALRKILDGSEKHGAQIRAATYALSLIHGHGGVELSQRLSQKGKAA